jgi:hypothetical protein
MVDGLYESARDGILQIQCKETVSEMRTFIEENGSYNAEVGCKDERVDTAGMASQMIKFLPRRIKTNKKEAVRFTNWENKSKPKDDGGYMEIRVA